MDDVSAMRLRRAGTAPVTYSLSVPRLPERRPFLIAAGLDECLRHLQDFRLDAHHCDMLVEAGVCARKSASSLRGVRFTGDVRAVPEGRVLLVNEPLLELTAPFPVAYVVQREILQILSRQSRIASGAVALAPEADEGGAMDLPSMDREGEAALGARSALIAGFTATSDLAAAERFGLPGLGLISGERCAADVRRLLSRGEEVVAVLVEVDGGVDAKAVQDVRKAMAEVRAARAPARVGIRLSGADQVPRAFRSRRALDRAGLRNVRIYADARADGQAADASRASAVPIEGRLIDAVRAALAGDGFEMVSQLVDQHGVAARKPKTGTLPASKQIFRGERGDFLVVRGERCPAGHTALLEAVVLAGHPLKSGQPVSSARARCRTDLLGLRRRVLAADGAPPPAPKLSPRLRELRDRAARNAPSAHRPAWI
ncbi:nicotinate phosphoribosyltransferase [Actinomadura nitritigenes]|uniref:nicotinate phosphoribosyltransferase n=1 Tax=Actinomadura nitritigenes TaxID=134602 RepID=A0ABS3RG88_9ACTN|nr:hypothetical protein [Actinomadura nitritigenes]MBO2445255.1 hypothetical protein [Actinomadura nitritigenes]